MDGLIDTYLRLLLWLALGTCLALLILPALPKLQARLAKWRVHLRLKRALPASHYSVFRDVALRLDTADGPERIQFDHVVVSPYGVFVIETDPRSGWIFGRERDPVWTRIHYRVKRNFPNPLIRIRDRVRALQELLGLDAAVFHPLVVFAGSAELRTPLPSLVTRLGGMLPYIQVRTETLLGFEQAFGAAAAIEAKRLPPGVQSTAAQIARLRRSEGQRFGTRQAVLALILMVSLSAVAGTLIHNLAEVPGRFPTQSETTLTCAYSADTGLCTCADRRSGSYSGSPSGSPSGPGVWGVEIADKRCKALPDERFANRR
jgi:restriction system protein